jgi:hypothetical protein
VGAKSDDVSPLPTVTVGPHRIEYSVVKGRSRRNVYFRFRSDGILEIIVPARRRVDLIEAIRSRSGWIEKHYVESFTYKPIFNGETLMYGGKPLNIVFEEDHDREDISFEPSRGVVVMRTSDKSRAKELIRRGFLRETSRYVVRRVAELAPQIGVKYSMVDVREVKSWGYCTRNHRLSFSWQLIALPENLREYVILHELTHLIEFNHSSSFEKRLTEVCPNHRERERELSRVVSM